MAAEVETALFARLKAQLTAANTALSLSTKVYQGSAPDNAAMPFIVFKRIGTRFDHTQVDISAFKDTLYEVGASALTFDDIDALAQIITNALAGWRSAPLIQGVLADSDFYLFEDEEKIHRRILTFRVLLNQ